MTFRIAGRCAPLLFLLAPGELLAGGRPATQLDPVTVIGTPTIGRAVSAGEGVVLDEQLAARPITRVAELLEFVPGMIATQHSGEGKANQYFLRGFNLDHGTDFATFVDAMPVNLRSHGHGQGYSDLNFLIPELVESLSYRKGPYSADVGDFSAAGNARFRLRHTLAENQITLIGGRNGYGRGLLAGAPTVLGGTLLMAADVTRYDGPWVLDQDLQATKLFARYSRGDAASGFHVTLMGYDSEWTSTDQIPLRAVESGAISRLGFIDPTVGGDTSRYSLSFGVHRADASGSRWEISGYAIDYGLSLFSNFTYFLEDPVDGDQFEQRDARQVYGLTATRAFPLTLAGLAAELAIGSELRHDAIGDVGLFRTQARQRLGTVRQDRVDETSLGLYAELRLNPTERLRVVAGLRADGYRFDVASDTPQNSGTADDAIVSPKLSLAFAATPAVDLFANIGRGFHSNDARGSTIRVDPASPTLDPVDPVQPLVAADAVDLGATLRIGEVAQLSATLWGLQLESELVYVGDGGATEPSDASERYGVELAAYLTPQPWLIIDLDYAWSHARLDIDDPANRIPGAVEQVASLGLTLTDRDRLSGGLRLRYLGEAPLIEDNSARSNPTVLLNLEAGYRVLRNLTFELGLYNVLDSRDRDITYFYESRLPGEPAEGLSDIHFHPVEPRQLRARLDWRF